MPEISSIRKPKIFAVVALVLQNVQNLVISHCHLAENGNEMYKELQCTCTVIVLLKLPYQKKRGALQKFLKEVQYQDSPLVPHERYQFYNII